MADMEGLEQVGKEEEMQNEGQDSGPEFQNGEWLKINANVTIYRLELFVIYACTRWSTRWSNIEIKEIVGHAMLELDDCTYDALDMNWVIDAFRDPNHNYTRSMKAQAEELKERWIEMASDMRKKYDRGLAKKRNEKQAAQQAAQEAASLIRPGKRRRVQQYDGYPSIDSVMTGSSSQSQGDRGRDESGYDWKWDVDDDKKACSG